jgi:hypothetical protein
VRKAISAGQRNPATIRCGISGYDAVTGFGSMFDLPALSSFPSEFRDAKKIGSF